MKQFLIILYIFSGITLFISSCVAKKEMTSSITANPKDVLMDRVQKETFLYFWEACEPVSKAARERLHMDDVYGIHHKDITTSGGTGFGIMALIVGIERGFISRKEGFERLQHLVDWLEKAEKFHGAWSHWWNPDGTAYPFSRYDDGGDLVETAFLAQGLIVARQYFKKGNPEEIVLAQKMDALWRNIEWSWYTKGGENVLYWHWSPKHGWKMNFPVGGYNECLIMYVLGASSPTFPIKPEVFHQGFMRNGDIVSDKKLYGIETVLDHYENDDIAVGPLFWSHYSFLGLDPRGLKDQYADYWKLCRNHVEIHYEHAKRNPYDYKGYSEKCWGMTSSYSINGYSGHNPQEDLGVISPTAALSSFPFLPEAAYDFLAYLYENKPQYIGKYGPYDAFSEQSDWFVPHYLAIDQGPIPVMIENHRSGLLWDLFMSAPEIQQGLDKLGFTYRKVNTY